MADPKEITHSFMGKLIDKLLGVPTESAVPAKPVPRGSSSGDIMQDASKKRQADRDAVIESHMKAAGV